MRRVLVPSPQLTIQTLAVLGTMSGDPGSEWYGLELSKRSGLKPGTIYPILARLLEAGWLERHWEDSDPAVEGRPRRRLYRLTGTGAVAARHALDQQVAVLQGHGDQRHFNPRPQPTWA
jgi:DNA-binding PadR family transcriptional regulator